MPAHAPFAIPLRDILPEVRGARDVPVASLASDPRQVQPGDLFVAVQSGESDGHEHIPEAVARGASAILAERLVPASIPVAIVDDTREALGILCQAMVGRPSAQMRTVGVTGSMGKTVTCMLIASILEAAQRPVGVLSTLGYSDSIDQAPALRTTPHAPELAHWMGRMRAATCRDAVIELSSRALAERRVAGVQFDVALLTNLRREHAAWHGSLANYRQAKERLFSQLKPSGIAVLNADDVGSHPVIESLKVPVLTFGRHMEANVTAEILERSNCEQTFLIHAGEETAPVCTRMIGDHHVSNCLAAATVGLAMGLDLATIVRGLEKVEFVPGRMERIECGQNFSVFIDGGRTPDGLAIALRTARQATTGRVICVFGTRGHHDQEQRPLLGRVAERSSDLFVLTSDNPRSEEPLQIAHDILDGVENPGRAHIIPSRDKAIAWALSQAKPGDAVVIAGKGDRNYQRIGKRRLAWNDADLAREWLYDQEAPMILPFRRAA